MQVGTNPQNYTECNRGNKMKYNQLKTKLNEHSLGLLKKVDLITFDLEVVSKIEASSNLNSEIEIELELNDIDNRLTTSTD